MHITCIIKESNLVCWIQSPAFRIFGFRNFDYMYLFRSFRNCWRIKHIGTMRGNQCPLLCQCSHPWTLKNLLTNQIRIFFFTFTQDDETRHRKSYCQKKEIKVAQNVVLCHRAGWHSSIFCIYVEVYGQRFHLVSLGKIEAVLIYSMHVLKYVH